MSKKVIIVGTKQGMTTEEIKKADLLAKQYLTDFLGYNIIEKNPPPHAAVKHGKLVGIANTLKLMADADLVYVTRNWENSPACSLEVQAAKSFNIQIVYEKDVIPEYKFKVEKPSVQAQIASSRPNYTSGYVSPNSPFFDPSGHLSDTEKRLISEYGYDAGMRMYEHYRNR